HPDLHPFPTRRSSDLQRISHLPPRIADPRVRTAAGNAVAQADVAGRVHGDASHPAIIGVRGVSALLIDGGRAAGAANLVPAHAEDRKSTRLNSSHQII